MPSRKGLETEVGGWKLAFLTILKIIIPNGQLKACVACSHNNWRRLQLRESSGSFFEKVFACQLPVPFFLAVENQI